MSITKETLDRPELLIGGRWAESRSGRQVPVHNPATGAVLGSAAVADEDDIGQAVALARDAFEDGRWRRQPPDQRAAVLRRAADLLSEQADEIAELMTARLGCPIWFSRAASVPLPIAYLRYYADQTEEHAYQVERGNGRARCVVRQEPVGVLAALTPWNSPTSLPALKIAPALGAGCSVVVKPAPETPLVGYYVAEALMAAGLPDGVLSMLPGDGVAGARLAAHPGVDKVSFTGSTATGKRVMAACADRIARVALELGGKSAAVITDDVDLDDVIAHLLPMAFRVNGQACINQTRILLPEKHFDDMRAAIVAAVAQQRVGDPTDAATELGPLINHVQQGRVGDYVEGARREGARIDIGGEVPSLPGELAGGSFYAPTVISGVDNSARVAREEIFGPVITLLSYRDDEEAARIANDSPYGLAGSVWCADESRAVRIAEELRTGLVSVNGAAMYEATPFGGFKQSGIGREMGIEGFLECLEYKTVALPV